MHSGWRAAVYDSARDCLWIVTRLPAAYADQPMYVTLTRVGAASHQVRSIPTQLDATGWVGGFMLLDSHDRLWMAWGRLLSEYDPDTDVTRSFPMPAFVTLGVVPHIFSQNGNFVSAVMGPTGEIWFANDNVPAIFGFNTNTTAWDRTLHLPWVPYMFTRLAVLGPGTLLVNGFSSPDYRQISPQFAEVDTATGQVTDLHLTLKEYALLGRNTVILIDGAGALATLDLASGKVSVLAAQAPVQGNGARFIDDQKGEVWFAMNSYRSIGVGRLDLTSGDITSFPFPYIFAPGSPIPNDCPSAAFHCVPKGAIWGVQVDAVAPDKAGNVWVVTDGPGSHDPKALDYESAPMAPVVELRPEDSSFGG